MQYKGLRRHVFVAALAGLLAAPAWPQGDAVTSYRNGTMSQLAACAGAYRTFRSSRLAIGSLQKASDWRECVAAARTASRPRLEAALESVGKPAARANLRKYDLAYARALAGIEPQADESREGYDTRQGGLLHLLTHAWTTFQLAE